MMISADGHFLSPNMRRVLVAMFNNEGQGSIRRGVRHNSTRNAMKGLMNHGLVEPGEWNGLYKLTETGRRLALAEIEAGITGGR
jgi:hypothetical protein